MMIRFPVFTLCILIALPIIFACAPTPEEAVTVIPRTPQPSPDSLFREGQNILFEVVSSHNDINGMGWQGYYINKNGEVFKQDWQWDEQRGNMSTTETKFLEKYIKADRIQVIAPENLAQMILLMNNISGEVLSQEVSTGCNDFGLIRFYSYKYNEDQGLYYPTLLYQAGDRRIENKLKDATNLYKQIDSIVEQLNSLPEGCR
jgi:hypothetical protein